jgi:nucleotide-binding universal stress UspA family protein
MTRVLMALDGSELDGVICSTVRRVFPDAELLAINVQERPGVAAPYGAPGMVYGYVPAAVGVAEPIPVADDDEAVERRRDEARLLAEGASPDDAIPLGEIGDPTEMILAAAERHHADAVAVGTHDRGWWASLVRPSVSEHVLDTSTVPVLLVREPPAGDA